jgi:hypothetical protein
MSRAGVGLVIEKLLTDEDLRIRLALEPMETVAELFLRGGDLTPDEIDLFCWTDAAVWFLADAVTGEWQLVRGGGPCDAATLVAGRNDHVYSH